MKTEVMHSAECVVIGGGVAGIEAALNLADMGMKVHLVEKGPTIGGRMAQLDKIFPVSCHGGCRQCSIGLVSREFGDCLAHPNITLYDCTEVLEVTGSAGEFRVRALRHPRFVDPETCILCGDCTDVCPISLPDEFNEGLTERRAIYLPHAQAIPNAYVVSKRGTAPCVAACPGELKAQGYISLTAERRYEEALDVIKQHNPFPATVARVCDHPCEEECYRGDLDEPVAICALEGFVADSVYSRSQPPEQGPQPTATARVAIVGAGPTGLSAAHFLASMGYGVVVLEAQSDPGGSLLRISESIVPRDVVRREIDEILALGVELRLQTPVSDIHRLLDEGYDAIFLAAGESDLRSLLLSGEGAGTADERVDLSIDSVTLETGRPGVFAWGRSASDSAALIEAIADGHRAALSIDRHLRGAPLVAPYERLAAPVVCLTEEEVAELYHSDGVNRGPREIVYGIGGQDRVDGAPVIRGVLTEEQAYAEALRCLRCGLCSDCGLCVGVCPTNCIDLQMRAEPIDLKAGAIVVATGFTPLDPSELEQYGYGRHRNVVTSLEYERLIGASGPTGGHLQRPSDGRPVNKLGFIQCVGSRDISHSRFCSSICCMFATQEAIVANERDPEVHSSIFYMDLRAAGKGFQACVDQARNVNHVTYRRGRVAEISADADECPIIWYEDTHSGKTMSETVDLAVLVTGLRPRGEIDELADVLGIELDEFHFVKTDPYSPTDTSREGIYACGFCRAPADITESVSQASAAAARAAELVLGG